MWSPSVIRPDQTCHNSYKLTNLAGVTDSKYKPVCNRNSYRFDYIFSPVYLYSVDKSYFSINFVEHYTMASAYGVGEESFLSHVERVRSEIHSS